MDDQERFCRFDHPQEQSRQLISISSNKQKSVKAIAFTLFVILMINLFLCVFPLSFPQGAAGGDKPRPYDEISESSRTSSAQLSTWQVRGNMSTTVQAPRV